MDPKEVRASRVPCLLRPKVSTRHDPCANNSCQQMWRKTQRPRHEHDTSQTKHLSKTQPPPSHDFVPLQRLPRSASLSRKVPVKNQRTGESCGVAQSVTSVDVLLGSLHKLGLVTSPMVSFLFAQGQSITSVESESLRQNLSGGFCLWYALGKFAVHIVEIPEDTAMKMPRAVSIIERGATQQHSRRAFTQSEIIPRPQMLATRALALHIKDGTNPFRTANSKCLWRF